MELTIKHLDFANNGKVRLTRFPHWDFENVSLQDCELAFNSISKEPYLRYKGVTFGLDQIKCYKLSLSDLTKEITINGETFVSYDKLKGIVSESQWVKICDTINEDYNKICDMPYWYVNQLHKWHFDCFGLLENNLAININEINNL